MILIDYVYTNVSNSQNIHESVIEARSAVLAVSTARMSELYTDNDIDIT